MLLIQKSLLECQSLSLEGRPMTWKELVKYLGWLDQSIWAFKLINIWTSTAKWLPPSTRLVASKPNYLSCSHATATWLFAQKSQSVFSFYALYLCNRHPLVVTDIDHQQEEAGAISKLNCTLHSLSGSSWFIRNYNPLWPPYFYSCRLSLLSNQQINHHHHYPFLHRMDFDQWSQLGRPCLHHTSTPFHRLPPRSYRGPCCTICHNYLMLLSSQDISCQWRFFPSPPKQWQGCKNATLCDIGATIWKQCFSARLVSSDAVVWATHSN